MAPDLPGRSLIAAEYLQPEEDGQVRVLLTCDCGTATDLTVTLEGTLPGSAEAAFTCDGCHTVRWFTITATGNAAPERPAGPGGSVDVEGMLRERGL